MAKQEKSAAERYREERKQRIAKAAKKNNHKSHSASTEKALKAIIAIVLAIAVLGGSVGAVLHFSNALEKGKMVITVGETQVDKYEYGYYYVSAFNETFNTSYQYEMYGQGYGAMLTGYNCSLLPSEQSCPMEIEGVENPTFADYFDFVAKQQLQYVEACKIYAAENGIELDDADHAKVDEQIEAYKTAAETIDSEGDQKYSLSAYIRTLFGRGMTVKLLTKIFEDQMLVSKVSEVKTEEFMNSYSEDEIEKAYLDGLQTYGVVSLRNYVIKAETKETGKTDSSGNPETAVTKETLAAAKKTAENFAAAVSGDEGFKVLASEYEKQAGSEKYADMITDDSLTLLKDVTGSTVSESDEDFLAWAFDQKTEAGSTYIVEDETTGYTVYMMSEPVHKADDILTYDVRHILLSFPTTTATDGDAEEETEIELLDAAAYDVNVDIDIDPEKTKDPALYMETQDILKQYLEGDKTEEAFAELAKKYSADSNAEQGGIYEDVTLGKMVAPFEDWAMQNGRVKGDVGIVETTYGYHIMYYIDRATITWSDTIKSDLASDEFAHFAEEIVKKDNVKLEVTAEKYLEDIVTFTDKKAKNYISSMSSMSLY